MRLILVALALLLRCAPAIAEVKVLKDVKYVESSSDPMHQLDIRIAAQLAENRRAFDGFVTEAIEFAKQRNATNVTHGQSLSGRQDEV